MTTECVICNKHYHETKNHHGLVCPECDDTETDHVKEIIKTLLSSWANL